MRHLERLGLPDTADWTDTVGRLHRFALTLTHDGHAADDLTQQALANVLARAPGQIGNAAYLRRSLVRLWLDSQRSWRRRMAHLVRVAASATRWKTDRDRADEREQVERVRAAVALLPPRQRAVLTLRLIEGLDYADIADMLGCSLESVRASLHLARRRVRRVLGEEP